MTCISSFVLTVFSLAAFIAHMATAETEPKKGFKGDREGHDMRHTVPLKDVPTAPILSVEHAIKSIKVQPGFVVENVVAEPAVFNPVAMTFDANGRLWICEMTTFMPDVFGSGEHVPEGNIVILEDTNDDGMVDKRTVFLDDVILPRTITQVKGGILYADNSQLYFAEVLEQNGNISVGIHEVVDPTYAEGGNIEHKTNTMLYGMDNWYYNAKSNKRYQTLPLDADIPAQASEIYRNKYWKLIRGNTEYRGQWGLSMDDYGRLFHNGNSTPAHGEYLRPNSLLQNPSYWPKMGAHSIGDIYIYPARMNTGVNRGYLDGFLTDDPDNLGRLKGFTAASGSVIYRGDNFPERFYGMAITPEPAGNLISARYVHQKEGALTGEPVYPNSEMLASTDERFRPVNLYTAPDGTIYMLDMYHGIIQHKKFLTRYLAEQIRARDLDKNNNTMGRIYRLRWAQKTRGPQPNLSQENINTLVSHLGHTNGWWRDTARRLILERQDHKSSALIQELIQNTHNPITLINALWTLHGLNAVDYVLISQALKHKNNHVKIAALAVAEKLPKKHHKRFAKQLNTLSTLHYDVALQVALTAGSIQSPKALKASKKVLDTYLDKPYIRQAVASGLRERADEFIQLIGQYPDPKFMYIVNNFGKKLEDRTNRAQLSDINQTRYDNGKKLYNGSAACFACHGKDGTGIKGMGPSFWNSDWVIKSKDTLAKVMLHGLSGPIKVRESDWKEWKTNAVMPGMVNRPDLNDEDLTAISIYIRNAWGNAADSNDPITPETYARIRKETHNRTTPYTAIDFPKSKVK